MNHQQVGRKRSHIRGFAVRYLNPIFQGFNSAAIFGATRIKSILDDLLNQPRYLLVLRLTILLLLLYGSSSVILDVPLRVICGLMLISPPLLTERWMWVIICGMVWWVNATDWLWIDNHQFLITYWCLACAIGVSSKNPDRVLAWNGGILIGLTFLFATGWKILAGEYWDGSFLHYTFLTDGRVEAIATFIGGLNPDVLSQNQLLESTLKLIPQEGAKLTLGTSQRLRIFTLAASYWTLFIEGIVAAAFLLGRIHWLSRFRDWLLILFIITTYFLLPVLGFAYVLVIMGLAQCPPEHIRVRTTYLCLFGLLQLARLPWENLMLTY